MGPQLQLLVRAPRVRRLLAAHAQSSLGRGAGQVALLVLAYGRHHSATALAAVLVAQLVPAMALGPLLGAAADRWPRGRLLVGAELLGAVAFVGLAVVPGLPATLAFAVLAGLGQAVFHPTVLATLPRLVDDERLGVATALYGALDDLGYTAGPALAAAAFLVTGPEGVLLANAAAFVASAALLAGLDAGHAPGPAVGEVAPPRAGIVAETRAGWTALRANRTAIVLVASSFAAVCLLGATNVAELPLIRSALDGSDAQYGLAAAVTGLGAIAGSLRAGRAETVAAGLRTYVVALVACAAGAAACAAAGVLAIALAGFFALGFGNTLALVSEQLALQRLVPDEMRGRVFGLKHAVVSWAFAVAFASGGAATATLGPRGVFAAVAAGLVLTALAARALLTPRLAGEVAQPGAAPARTPS